MHLCPSIATLWNRFSRGHVCKHQLSPHYPFSRLYYFPYFLTAATVTDISSCSSWKIKSARSTAPKFLVSRFYIYCTDAQSACTSSPAKCLPACLDLVCCSKSCDTPHAKLITLWSCRTFYCFSQIATGIHL